MRLSVAVVTCCFSIVGLCLADDVRASIRKDTNIPAEGLVPALKQLAHERGFQLVFQSEIVGSTQTHGAVGELTPEDALKQLLKGTGLSYRYLDEKTVTIIPLSLATSGTGEGSGQPSPAPTTTSGQSQGGLWSNFLVAQVTSPQGDSAGAHSEQQNQKSTSEGALQEVIVTAEKRKERIQDVPMSISAFSGRELEDSGIDSAKDLQLLTPGLSMSNFNVNGLPSIRGIGAPLQSIGFDPSTAIYVDGVYSPRFGASLAEFMDVQRVEVLKGPQVVLYGRNAAAGAMNFISNEPKNQFGGDFRVQYGNLGLVRVNTAVDVPLVSDQLLFRAAVTSVKDDGYTENILNRLDRPGQQDLVVGRFTLKYFATDRLSFTLRGYFSDNDGAASAVHAADPSVFGTAYASVLQDPRKVASNQITSVPMDDNGVNLTVNWDLGWAKLTSISAWAKSTFGPMNYDFDGTEIQAGSQGVPGIPDSGGREDDYMTSEELYLAGQLARLDWLVGASYLHENGKDYCGTGGCFNVFNVYTGYGVGTDITHAPAAYTQLGYSLTDKLHLTGGIRYTHESKRSGASVDNSSNPVVTYFTDTWNKATYSGNVKYSLTDSSMVYASVATGFKSGGITGGGAVPVEPLNPENVRSYEAGIKSSLWQDRLRLDLSAFKYDYTDLQIQLFVPPANTIYQNAGGATGKGIELAAQALVTTGLAVDAGLSLLNAKYDQYEGVSSVTGQPTNFAGKRLTNAPATTFNIGATYTVSVHDFWLLKAQASYYHSSQRFYTPDNDPSLAQGAYGTLNARLGFEWSSTGWNVAVFGKNLTNTLIYTQCFQFLTAICFPDAPRTYGVEVGYHL
jgi:iron complex outermembrane receptor protein